MLSRIANRQGVIDEGSIDSADETVDSEVNTAAILAGGWYIDGEVAAKHHCINNRPMHMQKEMVKVRSMILSRYTGRPGTLGLTLVLQCFLERVRCCVYDVHISMQILLNGVML
jgi:hypothetical protein